MMRTGGAAKRSANDIFGERIRELRQKRGLTQVELAERCGFPQGRISDVEGGRNAPTLLTILRLALALECKVGVLMSVFDTVDAAALVRK